MDEEYEQALAMKDGAEAGGFSEDQWLAWEEKLALANGIEAKRSLVFSPQGLATPDFQYRAALCTLLEVQELLDLKNREADEKAHALLVKDRQEIKTGLIELKAKGFNLKIRRVWYRLAVLELEVATRLNKPEEELKRLAGVLATQMGIVLSDAAPANADVNWKDAAPNPTSLSNDLISTERLVWNALKLLEPVTERDMIQELARSQLQNMSMYARELYFHHAVNGTSTDWVVLYPDVAEEPLQLTSDQIQWILELFLDEFVLECTNVEGYLDVIAQDLKNNYSEGILFGSRPVHLVMPLSQLQALLGKEPTLFCNDGKLASAFAELLRAATRDRMEQDLHGSAKRDAELEATEEHLQALSVFGPCANTLRMAILYDQLRGLRFAGRDDILKSKVFEYLRVPRYGSEFVNVEYIRQRRADELVVFYAQSVTEEGHAQPTTTLRVYKVNGGPLRADDDLQLIKEVLFELWSRDQLTADDEQQLRQYLKSEFVDTEKAQSMIVSGLGGLAEWKDQLPRKGEELTVWSSKTEISFCESNASQFGVEDQVEIFVNVRNVKTLSVQVYEIRTIDYYTQLRQEVQGNISLDGLLPNEEQRIDLSHLSPWQKSRVHVKLASNTIGRRGVFVVEVFEKDTTCRAILRKGYLRHVKEVTSRGIEITVLDERGAALKNASLQLMNLKGGKAQPPRLFNPIDSSGVIVIPFRQPEETGSSRFAVVLQHEDFGFLSPSFDYTDATFTLTTDIYVDSEQLRPGEQATLLARPLLSVGSSCPHFVSSDMLTDIKATISFTSVNKSSSASVSHKIVEAFGSVDELMQGRYTFAIPLDAEGFTVEVSARVKAPLSSGAGELRSLPLVRSYDTFAVQRVTQFEDAFTPHFLRRPAVVASPNDVPSFEYYIAVLGHNGEPIPKKQAWVRVQHLHFKKELENKLETDETGEILLGRLAFVQSIVVQFASEGGDFWTWRLPNQRVHAQLDVSSTVGETIRIPTPRAYSDRLDQWIQSGLVQVSRVVKPHAHSSQSILEVVPTGVRVSCVKNPRGEGISVALDTNEAGIFKLTIRPLDLQFNVHVTSKEPARDQPNSQQLMALHPKPTRSLVINHCVVRVSPQDGKRWLHVAVDEADARTTRVWVAIKRVLDHSGADLASTVNANESTHGVGSASSFILQDNEYLVKRKISDEYSYILQRRAFVKANPGSIRLLGAASFPKPSLLQTPHVVDQSDMEELVLRDGEKVTGFKKTKSSAAEDVALSDSAKKMEHRRQQVRYASRRRRKCARTPEVKEVVASLSFLEGTSSVIACSVDSSGDYSICLSDVPIYAQALAPHLELQIVAFDTESGQVGSLETQINTSRSSQPMAKRDVRLSSEEALDSDTPSMQIQHHEILRAGETRTFTRMFSSKYAIYETLGSAMDLWAALCTNTAISNVLEQLKAWPVLTKSEKISFYMKNACDDVNFFLYRKDPSFFQSCIRHFVQAKVSKSLMDLYVLEDTLEIQQRYALAGVFQNLSVVEKLLVAERAATAKQTISMCEHVIHVIDGVRTDLPGSGLSRVFESVLSQGLLKPEDAPAKQRQVMMMMAQRAQQLGAQMTQQSQLLQAQMPQASPAYSPTSPAYSPTSPAYSPTSPAIPTPFSDCSDSFVAFDDDMEEDDFGMEADDAVSLGSDLDEGDDDDEAADNTEHDHQVRKQEARKRRAQPYVLPGKVRRVQEKRFFGSQKPQLDGRNMFWKDYAQYLIERASVSSSSAHETQPSAFLSSHFPEASRSFTEGLLALSVLDLTVRDVTPTGVQLIAGGLRVQLDAMADVVLYHQGIGPGAVVPEPNTTLILKQRLVASGTATSGDFADIRPAREFIVNRIYSCIVSVSNIGSQRLKDVNLLMQIPRGSIPLTATSFYTKNEVIEVAPHDTKMLSFDFYFPAVGEFTQYPSHASLGGKVVAWAVTDHDHSKPITVVAKATAVDLTSWSDVAARGSLEDVLSFLKTEDSEKVQLDKLAWRCRERQFYSGLVSYLRQRWEFVESIWKYAFQHNDTTGMQELIAGRSKFLRVLGHGVHTSIVQLRGSMYNQERFDSAFGFDHTEFGPLLSRRAHRVSGQLASSSNAFSSSTEITAGSSGNEPARVMHKKAREYYRTLCQALSLQASLTADQLMVMAYFLILFHRIEDALAVFERAKTLQTSDADHTVEFSVAADCIDTYLDFFRPQSQTAATFPTARRNVAKYAKLENTRWRERFSRLQEVLSEYDELRATALADAQQHLSINQPAQGEQSERAVSQRVPDDGEVRLTAEVKGDQVHLTSQNLGACEISFYRIDVELMFSTAPFDSFSDAAATKSSLLLVKPWKQLPVELQTSESSSHTVWKMPSDLAVSPMLLRIREVEASRTVSTIAPPIDLTRSYFNAQLQVVVTKQAGFLQVLHNGLPVPACYVKAYAKVSSLAVPKRKQTEFYKDGYTDVIGKFDYAAINGDLLTRVEAFSILVSHPTLGTTVQKVAPPVLAVASGEFNDREALWF